MNKYISSIEDFKSYAISYLVPDYFKDYVESLDDQKLEWFYNQVQDALQVLTMEEYLVYKFKWISKREFTDLTKEIYVEYLYNPEMFSFEIIKPEWEKILDKRYEDDPDVKYYHMWF